MVIFSTGLVIYLADQRSEAMENNVMGTTRALVSAVDENISSMVSGLRILSESEGFEADTIQFLHKRLRLFVKKETDWDHISFADTSGTQIFNTRMAFGKKLPRLNQEPWFRTMLKTGAPVISDYRKGEGVITVAVPVKKNNVIIYALIGSLKISSFDRLLKAQNLPGNWTAAILDNDLRYLAHSRNPGHFTGRKASASVVEKTRGKSDYGFTFTSDSGTASYGALANSKVTNWKIFIRIPDDGHLFTSWKTISYIILAGLVFLGFSLLTALLIARNISRPLQSLAGSARALGKGSRVPDIRTNLTEIIEVNDALKAAANARNENEKKIQEAVRIRDTFLSVASHELKSPITTLKLQFQMLERVRNKNELIPQSELEKPLSRVQSQVARLNNLVDELLDVTRISAGKLSFNPEPLDLVTLAEEIIQGSENAQLISFRAPETLSGIWDRHRLTQVLVNLISNAIKYGNGKPVTVTIGAGEDSAWVEVKDQGLGISRENIGRIFERYERVGNHQGISGLGLGLWIVKKILEGMQAEITVSSREGEGSVFRVTLPRSPVNHVTTSASPQVHIH